MQELTGKVLTVRGPVAPAELGSVMMHEHLHSDIYEWNSTALIQNERRTAPERRQYLLDNAVPLLRKCRDYGMHAYVDVTMPPWRAWPTLYREVSELSGVHIVLCTGFYREIEIGKYWAKTAADAIWPYARNAPIEELVEFCTREIVEGINGTDVRAGLIKLGTSQAPMTPTEIKTFRVGARVQKATGVHITTHCSQLGAETSQLTILEEEGVDLTRVVIGHTAEHVMRPHYRQTVLEWMRRGANFLPTNMGVPDVKTHAERWRPLVEAIHHIFQEGHGDKIVLGLDSGYCTESGKFEPMTFLPPHPWTHMHTHTLPALRSMGLTAEEEKTIMETNPQRIVAIR